MVIKNHFMKGTEVSSLIDRSDKRFVCCKVDGHVQDLNYILPRDMDAEIEFLDLTNPEATKIYESSLRLLVYIAIKRIDEKLDVRFFYNVSRSIFCRVNGRKNMRITSRFVEAVRREMERLVSQDLPIRKKRMSKEEALAIYRKEGLHDKIDVLRYRPENFAHLYEVSVDGKSYHDYLYSPMVPSTGYLKKYNLRFYQPGFLIQVPRAECQGEIPPFRISAVREENFRRGNSRVFSFEGVSKRIGVLRQAEILLAAV